MALIQRGLMVMATAGALAIPAHLPAPVDGGLGSPVKKTVQTQANFQPNQLEYYLGDGGIAYVRPGVNVKIVAVTNATPGNKPVVEFLLTDDVGQPLDRNGAVTPGVISPGFIMGAWNMATRYYIAYTGTPTTGTVTSASRDQGGTYTDLEVGHYKYNFGQAIPATHDVKKAITIGVYASRTLASIIGKNYYAPNVFTDFKTDGGAVAAGQVWSNMDVAKSCNRCHDPLGGAYGATQFHGGTRSTVKMCVLCHNETKGTNGQADAKMFFHKIHMGKYLPSVANGTYVPYDGDWSTVGWPGNNNRAPYDCTTCHETSAGEKEVWYTRPSRKVCGSCHDDVNFATGLNHSGASLVQLNDDECAKCHQPQGDLEFDASIRGAHTIPENSVQLKGLKATIVSATNMKAGQKPTAVFKLTNGDGTAVDGSKLNSFSPKLAGPTTSYSTYFSETGAATAKFDASTGLTSYTFTNAIPATAGGTWAISLDAYRNINLKRGDGGADIVQRECAQNPVSYYSIDGSVLEARRTSVTMAQCNQCHVALGLHGGQRMVIEECIICHNPTEGDQARRPATAGAKESVSMQRMIHRIHTGEELYQDYTVYGFGGSINNFNEVRFPGDRRNCVKCHTATGYQIPLADERAHAIDSVTTLRDYYTPQGPETAACLGCHDLRDNAAHAYLNTAPFGEACASCHGVGLEYGVDKVHAR